MCKYMCVCNNLIYIKLLIFSLMPSYRYQSNARRLKIIYFKCISCLQIKLWFTNDSYY